MVAAAIESSSSSSSSHICCSSNSDVLSKLSFNSPTRLSVGLTARGGGRFPSPMECL